jgi:hypothetical protein
MYLNSATFPRKRMNQCLKVMVVVLLFSAISSCTPPVRLFLYNHTESKVLIGGDRDLEVIEPGTLREIKLFNKPIRFRLEERQLDYPVPTIPLEFWDQNSAGYSDVLLQLEPSHKIYLIRPKGTLPAKDLGDQPAGFPLTPHSATALKTITH